MSSLCSSGTSRCAGSGLLKKPIAHKCSMRSASAAANSRTVRRWFGRKSEERSPEIRRTRKESLTAEHRQTREADAARERQRREGGGYTEGVLTPPVGGVGWQWYRYSCEHDPVSTKGVQTRERTPGRWVGLVGSGTVQVLVQAMARHRLSRVAYIGLARAMVEARAGRGARAAAAAPAFLPSFDAHGRTASFLLPPTNQPRPGVECEGRRVR